MDKTGDNMGLILLKTMLPHQAEAATLALIANGFKASKFHFSYIEEDGLIPKDYPLTIEGIFDDAPVTVKAYGVSAGVDNSQSQSLIKILETAGFVFDHSIFLTKKWFLYNKISVTGFVNGTVTDDFNLHH